MHCRRWHAPKIPIRHNRSITTNSQPTSIGDAVHCMSADRDIHPFEVKAHSLQFTQHHRIAPPYVRTEYKLQCPRVSRSGPSFIPADSEERSRMTLDYNTHASTRPLVLIARRSAMVKNCFPAVRVWQFKTSIIYHYRYVRNTVPNDNKLHIHWLTTNLCRFVTTLNGTFLAHLQQSVGSGNKLHQQPFGILI